MKLPCIKTFPLKKHLTSTALSCHKIVWISSLLGWCNCLYIMSLLLLVAHQRFLLLHKQSPTQLKLQCWCICIIMTPFLESKLVLKFDWTSNFKAFFIWTIGLGPSFPLFWLQWVVKHYLVQTMVVAPSSQDGLPIIVTWLYVYFITKNGITTVWF